MFASTAKVEYHTNWVIAKCDPQLLEYYRWLVLRKTGLALMRPMNGAHISLVRGDIEKGVWERNLNGETIEFTYTGNMLCFSPYIWLPVGGADLGMIREKIGLRAEPLKAFHMSVGRVEDRLIQHLNRGFGGRG